MHGSRSWFYFGVAPRWFIKFRDRIETENGEKLEEFLRSSRENNVVPGVVAFVQRDLLHKGSNSPLTDYHQTSSPGDGDNKSRCALRQENSRPSTTGRRQFA